MARLSVEKRAERAFAKLLGMKAPVLHWGKGWGGEALFAISGEMNFCKDYGNKLWADYYDAPAGWDFGVNPEIEKVMDQYGLFCEWQNAGVLDVFDNE